MASGLWLFSSSPSSSFSVSSPSLSPESFESCRLSLSSLASALSGLRVSALSSSSPSLSCIACSSFWSFSSVSPLSSPVSFSSFSSFSSLSSLSSLSFSSAAAELLPSFSRFWSASSDSGAALASSFRPSSALSFSSSSLWLSSELSSPSPFCGSSFSDISSVSVSSWASPCCGRACLDHWPDQWDLSVSWLSSRKFHASTSGGWMRWTLAVGLFPRAFCAAGRLGVVFLASLRTVRSWRSLATASWSPWPRPSRRTTLDPARAKTAQVRRIRISGVFGYGNTRGRCLR
mmetsp:Transcript_10942/g.26340  ORF Transcript_10942/g.26340 Transcript_10942/m.26340 type:complete len:289 (+) Transcript_10942:890-1756(+)